MKTKALAVLVLVIIAGIVVYMSHRPSPPTGGTVRIGALLALTGSGANYGKSLQQGIELAKDEINSAGGINGKKLEVIYEDSQGDAKTGVLGFNKLTNINKVPVVIGSISSVILAVAPVADQSQVVLINSSAISPKICATATNFVFSVMVSGAQEAEFMARELATKHKEDRVAVLYSNNASGIDTKNTFVQKLTSDGGQVAVEEGYELNSTDFRTQLTKIRDSGATCGYLIAFSSREFARVLIQSREMGLRLQWYSYSGFETKETLELAAAAAEGVIYSYPDYGAQTAAMEAFQKEYQKRYESWPDIYTATSYDGVKMLSVVFRATGTNSIAIRDGLRRAGTYTGVFGELRFATHQCVEKPLVWKTVRNGRYELLTR